MQRRLVVSALILLTCVPALAGYLLMTLALLSGKSPIRGGLRELSGVIFLSVSFGGGWIAWLALAHMSVGWIGNTAVSRRWPVVGSIAGVIGILPFLLEVRAMPVLLLVMPAMLFAVFLCRWHWTAATLPGNEVADHADPH